MMSSTQIAQQNYHAFSMGYGSNPGMNSYEGLTGFTPFGHGAGSQVGANMLGGINTAVNTASIAGLAGLGGKALLGKLGLGATGAARAMGGLATMTGATLPVAAGLGLMLPGFAALSGLATGGQQYAQTQGMMDNIFGNRLGMGGAFGYGVSRDDALRMTEAMRSLKAVPEMMTSMGELQDVLQSVSKMGILQASRNASEFKDKFTSMVHALRDMSRDLGSTMKEATAMFGASVGQGFLNINEVSLNARMAKSASAVGIGMDTNRMMGLQSGGAAMLRSMGGDSRAGAFGARDIASSLSVANQRGIVSSQDILRITGKVGEEGVAALSQQLMQAQVRMFQGTGAGRFITAALAERGEDGRFTGNLNSDLLSQLRSGEITGDALMSRGRRMLSGLSDEQALSFMNAMERGMGAKAGALAGAGGSANAISAILDQMGARNEEAKRALIRQITGVSQAHADVMLQMARNAASINDDKNQQMLTAAIRDRSASYFKENMISGQIHHATTQLQSIFVDPFHSAGSRFAARAGNVFDEITDEFVTGSTGDKINMLLNPGMHLYNAGRLLFSDPSTRQMTQTGRSNAMSRLFRGNTNLPNRNNQNRRLGDVFTEEYSDTPTFGGMAKDFLSSGGGTTAALIAAGLLIPGVNIGLGAALMAGGVVGSGFMTGRTLRKGLASPIAAMSEKAFGNRTLGEMRTSFDFTSDFRRSSLDKFREVLQGQGSASNLRGKSVEQIVDFVASMGGDSAPGIDVLKAAAQEDKEGHAAEILTLVSSMMDANAARGGDLSVADAESRIKELTSSSFFGGNLGRRNRYYGIEGLELHSGNVNSMTIQNIALSGDEEKQKAILRILRDQNLIARIARNMNNDKQLRQIASELGGVLTFEELKSLATDLASASTETGDYAAFGQVAEGLETAMARINLSDRMDVAMASVDAIKASYGTAGADVANLMQSGGLFQNIGSISEAIRSGTGGGARMKNLRASLGRNRFNRSTESELERVMKAKNVTRADLESAGIVFDDTLTEEEGMIASQLLAVMEDLQPDVGMRTSKEAQRAAKLGLTPDLQLKIAEQYEKAISASKETLRMSSKYIQVATDKITKLDDRITNLESGVLR